MKDVISQGRNPEKKCRYCRFAEHGNRQPDPGHGPKAVYCSKNQVRVSMSLTCASWELRPSPLADLVEPPKTLRIEVYPKELDLIKQLLEARAAVLSHKVILSSVNHRNAPEEERLAAEIDFVRDLRMRLSFVGPDRSAT